MREGGWIERQGRMLRAGSRGPFLEMYVSTNVEKLERESGCMDAT